MKNLTNLIADLRETTQILKVIVNMLTVEINTIEFGWKLMNL